MADTQQAGYLSIGEVLGLLLEDFPGTGKTPLAKAIARFMVPPIGFAHRTAMRVPAPGPDPFR